MNGGTNGQEKTGSRVKAIIREGGVQGEISGAMGVALLRHRRLVQMTFRDARLMPVDRSRSALAHADTTKTGRATREIYQYLQPTR